MASPFEPLPPNIPDTCRTAEVFRKLYAQDLTKLFTNKQTKEQFYEKINQIVPLDRCFCYFRDLGIEPQTQTQPTNTNEIPVTYEEHPYMIKLTNLTTVNSPTLAKELEYTTNTNTNTKGIIELRPLLNNIIISYVINYTFLSKLKVASSLHLYGASICPKKAVEFYEYANGGSLKDFVLTTNPHSQTHTLLLKHGYLQQIAHKTLIRRDLFQGILLQLFTALSYLQTQLQFRHNNLTTHTTYISYILDKTTGKLRFQIKLANFQKSTITTNQTDPLTINSTEASTTQSSPTADIYTFIFSLLTLEPFFNTFFHLFDSKSTFYKLWQLLFPTSQISEKYIKKVSPDTLTPISPSPSDMQTNKKLLVDIIGVLRTSETTNKANKPK